MSEGDSVTKEVESVTGSKLGTNELLKASTPTPTTMSKMDDKMFTMPKPKLPPQEQIGNVVLPPGSNPPPVIDKLDAQDSLDLKEEFFKYHQKRREILLSGKIQSDADKMGYENLTFEEFKKKYKKQQQIKAAQSMTPENKLEI